MRIELDPFKMSVYLIQPTELSGTNHYILGTEIYRRAGTRIVIQMDTPDPLTVKAAILSRFQEWNIVKEDYIEGDPKELRALFYQAVLTYEDTLPVKMDIDEKMENDQPTLFKYLSVKK